MLPPVRPASRAAASTAALPAAASANDGEDNRSQLLMAIRALYNYQKSILYPVFASIMWPKPARGHGTY
jgi:hypothetical protein